MNTPSRQAHYIAEWRTQRFEVIVDYEGEEVLFGYAETYTGGATMYLAKLVPWASNPRVRKRKFAMPQLVMKEWRSSVEQRSAEVKAVQNALKHIRVRPMGNDIWEIREDHRAL